MTRMDRRQALAALAAAAGAGMAGEALAQGAPAAAPTAPPPAPNITSAKLNDRLTVFSGVGGNVGVLHGPDGLLMIDGGLPNTAEALARAVAAADARPVQLLFNTHYHGDHVGSNVLLGRRGVKIIAHRNVRPRLATSFYNDAFQRTFDALPPEGLPSESFDQTGRTDFGRDRLEYTHVPMAHTDNDAFVFLPQMNVVHAGDLLWEGRYPVIDYSVGGSLARMVEGLAVLDRVGDANTRFISGHGKPSLNKAEMRAIAQIWAELNTVLERMVAEGRTLDEIRAANPTQPFDARVGPNQAASAANFIRQAHGGILARRRA